jgi:transcriptional antiterminator RfaH
MPILPLETFLYPDDLLDESGSSSAPLEMDEKPWWVLHTRPRTEKKLARSLLEREHGFFLPLLQKRSAPQGRKCISYVPMFPGYVFLHGAYEARLAALETNLIVQVLPVPDPQQLKEDLTRVHRLMLSRAPLSPEQTLLPGTPVEIIDGPFVGMRGKLLAGLKSGWRLLVEVRFLQCGVSVEIEPWMVRVLDAAEEEAVLAGGL